MLEGPYHGESRVLVKTSVEVKQKLRGVARQTSTEIIDLLILIDQMSLTFETQTHLLAL